jgi:hypothetical protein
MIMNLPAGKQVTVANPPASTDHASFSTISLRGVAAGLGVTYEDLTGDYSQVNYSSARMARLAFNADVHHWRWNMLVPQFCEPAWAWMIEALALVGVDTDAVAKWTPPPAQMLDPDKEGAAAMRAIRSGQLTLDEMVREQGFDPVEHWKEYAEGLKRLDDLEIVLDSDPRKTTVGGQRQDLPAPPPAPSPDPDEERRRVHEQLVASLIERAEDAIRQRDEVARQRDEANLRSEEANRRRDEERAQQDAKHEAKLKAMREHVDSEFDRVERECAAALEQETARSAAAKSEHDAEILRLHSELATERAARERDRVAHERTLEIDRAHHREVLSTMTLALTSFAKDRPIGDDSAGA